jgi:hypothetical protein
MRHIPILIAATLFCGNAVGETTAVIDWSAWDAILRAHVVDGHVDYEAIRSATEFSGIVDEIASADLTGEEPAAVLAFYINSYNVLAVKGILDGHSPKSSLGKLKFFYRDTYTIAGEELSLNTLEHKKIRPVGEPRIHFAIVCASASCPPLRSEAYLPAYLDQQLDDNARRFLNDSAKNRFDLAERTAYVSKIFKWFPEDFEQAAGSIQAYIASFVDGERGAESLRQGDFKIKYLKYDWSLNGTIGNQ